MPHRTAESLQVACAYVGTIVGAGFASGQELHQFFGRHDRLVYPAALLATFLFAWIGYRVMMLGHRLRANSYLEVSRHLFGKKMGLIVNVSLNVMLFGIAVAMLAGSGALFTQQVDVPFTLGALFTAVLTFLTLIYGLKGLMRANAVIVPLMFTCLGVLCIRVVVMHPNGFPRSLLPPMIGHVHPVSLLSAALSATVYVAFNVGLAAGVLIPIGGSMDDSRTLRHGAVMGAIVLGVMIMAVLSTLERVPDALLRGIPMAFVADQLGTWFSRCFFVVLFGEIFSTLVGDLFAIVTQIPPSLRRYRHAITALLLVLAFAASHVGFSSIIKYGYSLFGWISSAFLLILLWPRRDLK